MHLLASIFDPGDNGFDIGDAAALLAFVGLLVGSIVGLLRWTANLVRHIVREELEEYTKPIQPTANGGLSLPDVARTSFETQRMVRLLAHRQGIDLDDNTFN